MCIVSRGGDGDTAGTADVGVTQLVGQRLELVRVEPVVVPQDVVVRGATGALENNQMIIIIYNTKRGTCPGKHRTPQCLLLHRTQSSLLVVYHYIQHKLCLLLL